MDNYELLDENIQRLIIRYLEGNTTDDEIQILRTWLEQSGENFSLFTQLKKYWLSVGTEERYISDKAWNLLEARLQKPHRNFKWRWIGGAAVILLLLGIGGYFRMFNPVLPAGQEVVTGEIEPGSKKAILVLGPDRKVVLSEVAGDSLLQKTIAARREGNTLVYDEGREGENEEEDNCLITPRGGEYSVVLSDGTKVWLNSESELRYPVHFSGKERKVYLKGEAYFSVTKQQEHPFVVCSDQACVTVLGTEFNIRNYANEYIAATLVKGAIWVNDQNNKSEYHLKPGQQAVFTNQGITVREVEPIHYVAWKDGFFVYQDKRLDDIMKELSRWYDFTYTYQNDDLKTNVLTAKLKKFDRVDQIFKILERTGKFGFLTRGRTVSVYKK